MTHKLTTFLSSTTSLLTPKALKLTLVSLGVLSATQQLQAAEQEWWFDVEVILFERSLEPNTVSETFKQSSLTPKTANTVDLLTPYLKPDISYLLAGLPYCRTSKREEATAREEQKYALSNMEWINKLSATLDDIASPELGALKTRGKSDDDKSFSAVEANETMAEELMDPHGQLDTYINHLESVPYTDWQIPQQLPCAYAEQIDPSLVLNPPNTDSQKNSLLPDVPVKVNGTEWQTKMSAFLLPTDTFRMDDLYQSIKYQKGISPLMHIAWRQQVNYGRDNSLPIRLFTGKNYGNTYSINGELLPKDTDTIFETLAQTKEEVYIPESERLTAFALEDTDTDDITNQSSEDLFTAIDKALDNNTKLNLQALTKSAPSETEQASETPNANDIWQLDGQVSVYLRNIGRVPYLHIDSNFDYRHPVSTSSQQSINITDIKLDTEKTAQINFLESVNFNQLRRVISKQIHYFDHPLFGMVVTINRYQWPEVDTLNNEQ